jgi:branched-chain amino acid transport system permease protein
VSTWARPTLGLLAALLVLGAAAPLVLPDFAVSILTLVFISALLAASVNMLTGQVGLVSLGHAGIAASAAYAVAWATVHGHGVLVQLGLALALTVAVSSVYALTTMRSRGIVFLMITLALGMIVFGLAYRLASVTGGQNGLTGIDRPAVLAGGDAFHAFSVAIFGLAVAALWVVERSPFGLAMRGVRDSESRMASLGYSVPRIKFLAVMLSGLLAGASGVLAVWHAQFMSPAAATFGRSALAVVMVILGGAGTLLGPLVGAAVVVGTEHWLSSYVERWPTLLGLAFILVVLFAPRGVLGALSGLGGRSRARATEPIARPAREHSPTALRSGDRQPLEQGGDNGQTAT